MRTNTARSLAILSFTLPVLAGVAHDHAHSTSNDLEFHENRGQWPAQVLYRARTQGGAVFVEGNAFTYVIRSGGEYLMHGRSSGVPEPLRMHAYRVRFENADVQGQEGLDRMPHYVNYFLGNDPAHWGSGAAVFGAVKLIGLYPGIDMHVDGHDGMKYDWLVAAGADPSRIVMHYEGQDALRVEGGLLFVGTSAGQVVEQRPVAWQEVGGKRRMVSAEYVLSDGRVRFKFQDGYDPHYPLVIDPVVTFSSYVGSNADNFGCTATYDESGHLYGAGSAFGFGYPNTLGVVQPTFGGGTIDMGVSKFMPDGTSLVWSTYVGGSDNDLPHSMVVNSDDELYILGTTGSTDFPVSAGCYDASFAGGTSPPFGGSYGFTYFTGTDIAVVHLSADATSIVGATYVGGTGNDGLNQFTPLLRNYGDPFRGEIIMDLQERPVVATSTASTDMVTTPGATQSTFGGGLDAFVFRLDPSLSIMEWATYHGGSAYDAGFGVQVSSTGDYFMTGGTQSIDLPVSGTPFSGTFAGGVDGFLARYSSDGTSLLGATYFGTAAFDQSYFVQLDTQNNVYVVGQTQGAYPVSSGVYVNPSGSQFIQKFSNDLSASLWSTRIGSTGNENISPSAFLVSDCGQIYFSGWGGTTNPAGGGVTQSTTTGLPVTVDAYDSTTDGSDFYLMVLNEDAVSLAYATFFGGTAAEHVDGGTSRFDKNGIVYQAVCAGCGAGTFPTTPGAWSSTDMGQNCNLGVFKIDFEQNVQVGIDANITATGACVTEPVVFNAVGTADNWSWDLGDGTLSSETTFAHIYAEPGVYTVTLIGTAVGLCVAVDTAYLEINVVAPLVMTPIFDAVPSGDCDAVEVELFNMSTGSTVYFWTFGDGATSTLTNPVHSYAAPGDYTITLALIDVVCTDTVFLSTTVPVEFPGITLAVPSAVLCDQGTVNLNAGGGFDSYLWSTGEQAMIITVDQAGEYSVEVTDGFCTGGDTVSVLAAPTYSSLADVELCPGQSQLFAVPFASDQILWNDGSTNSELLAAVAGIYWYSAVDDFGCTVTDTAEVEVNTTITGVPVVPNVFTPNGDLMNEKFRVANIDAAQYQMDIYNRWGMKVFSSANNEVGWNGNLDNGSETVPDGTYFVIVTYKAYCSGEGVTTKTGHVTLLR